MALPLFGSKHPQTQLFLTLDIGHEAVTAALWTVKDGAPSFLQGSSPIEWGDSRVEELAEAADVAIEELGKKATEIDDVMLGLPGSWVKGTAILDDKKPYLKSLKDQLQLKPMGFVVSLDALIKYLQELEGGPINAILVEYTTSTLISTFVKAGSVQDSVAIERTGDTLADLMQAMDKVSLDHYPARIILYGVRMKDEELEQEKQKVLAHDWPKQGKFHHIPKIETLPHQAVVTAVCFAAGAESSHAVPAEKSSEKTAQANTQSQPSPQQNLPHQEMGKDLGFQEMTESDSLQNPAFMNESGEVVNPALQEQTTQRKAFPNPFAGIVASFKGIMQSLTLGGSLKAKVQTHAGGTAKMRKMLILGLAFFLLLTGGVLAFSFFTQKAEITIYLKTTPISTEALLTLDPSVVESDPSQSVLKVEEVEKIVEGEQETDTTGNKIVGDQAKGKVKIFNATSSEKVFEKGTVLTGPQNRKFTLNDTVTVASSSGDSALDTQLGSVEVNVTASDIGVESNLPAKTEFEVANFDKKTYVASNEEAFTGGTSREIQAVSKQDQQALEQLLTKNLIARAVEELNQEQASGEHVIAVGDPVVEAKQFSAAVGEEARILRLTMRVKAKAVRYAVADLSPVAEAIFQQSLTEGTMIRQEKTKVEPKEIVASSSAQIQLSALVATELIPPLDRAALAQQLAGRTIAQAESILRDQSVVASSEVKVFPFLARLLFGSLPSSPNNITIEVRVQE